MGIEKESAGPQRKKPPMSTTRAAPSLSGQSGYQSEPPDGAGFSCLVCSCDPSEDSCAVAAIVPMASSAASVSGRIDLMIISISWTDEVQTGFFAGRVGVCPALGRGAGFAAPAVLAPAFAGAFRAAGLVPDLGTRLSISLRLHVRRRPANVREMRLRGSFCQ